ncbi:MAG: beta-ketoacyl synthase N-terminal-like domain-containing protein [Methanosarcina sp.]
MEQEQIRIAVTGMACRFPGANNLNEFWTNLVEGKDSIKHFTDEELLRYEYNYSTLKNNPDYVKARGVLSDIDKFDAEFFGLTPNEASTTDPQHRIWLETVWDALENAGCDPFSFKGPIGVFAGGYLNTYLLNNILRDKGKLENYIRLRTTESFQILTGNDVAFIPTKTAYKFNLKGPAINVQTACSTSLVAISLACQSLSSFESDICIAGGVCIVVPQESGYLYQEGAIPSPDGKCKPFDENGQGTVFSNGIGVVILKRVEDAIRARDRIYAIVRGWALNNDGNHKVSYMAPSVDGQAEAILMAQALSEVKPEEIGYIEAHGTATLLGDPIELTALNKAFTGTTITRQSIGIGSVKSNIGHTDAAAGVASFIKSSMSVYNRIIPPSINFSKPNPHFDFANSPFYVQDKLKSWNSSNPLIIGVSSFGIGGTNAHVIIEEPPLPEMGTETGNELPYLIPLSAKTEAALNARKADLINYVKGAPGVRLMDIAYTLQTGRNHMQYRTYCIASSVDDILTANSFCDEIKVNDSSIQIAFMFSGQGAQHAGMGRELYNSVQGFRIILDECFNVFRSLGGYDIKEIIFGELDSDQADIKLAETGVTQPALFIIEYALAKFYDSLGIRADYFIGHSIGEYAAACLSGVFDFESALKIVIERGRLMQQMPSGKMYAIRCGMDLLSDLKDTGFEIAAYNSDQQCTISVNNNTDDALLSLLDKKGIRYVQLKTSHAFHSSAFDPILESFSRYVDGFLLNPPAIPFISCLTGEFITDEQATSGRYWAKQLRNTVRFKQGIETIVKRQDVVFLEVGPGAHLKGLALQNRTILNKRAVVSSLGKKDEGSEIMRIMYSFGKLWANGININFSGFNPVNSSRKITLPSYPFQRKRYWIDYFQSSAGVSSNSSDLTSKSEPSLKGRETITALKKLVCESSGYTVEQISETSSFEKMGFDSLFLTQYARNINKKFGAKVEFRQLISEYPTLESLSKMIDSMNPSLKKPGAFRINGNHRLNNFVRFQPEGASMPLVMLHGQTADTIMPEWFGKDRPYLGFLHPGSDGEKISFASVEEMASSYLEQLIRDVPQGPYCLAGFSFGGLVAYEMARKLEKMGQKVPCVFLFDSFAILEPFRWRNNIYSIIRSNFLGPVKREIERMVKMGVCELYTRLDIPTPLMFRNYYITHRYMALVKTFRPEKINSEVILFRAADNGSAQKCLGWDKYIDNIKIIPVKGVHVSILDIEENKQLLHAEMQKVLNSIQ